VALQAEDEPPVGGLEGLDQVAGRTARPRARDKAGSQLGGPYRLVVVRVDADDATAGVGREEDPGEPRPGRDTERMDERRSLPPARSLMAIDVPEQCPAREHVDGLEPAADTEDGQATLLCRSPRLVLERVAVSFDGRRATILLAVSLGMEVCAAADEESVHRGQGGGPHPRFGRGV